MKRPWITPGDIQKYTDSKKVKARSNTQLEFDISRAENYVISYTHNRFDTEEYANNIPDDIKKALILLAEAYALKSVNASAEGIMKSETFDDYSYTIATERTDLIADLQLGPMLEPYMSNDSGDTNVKLRKL